MIIYKITNLINGKVYPSIRIAANETGIGETMISRAVNGVIPHAKRTHWAFV